MEDKRLYIRVKCSVCRTGNPGCFYCDPEGKTFIEASDKHISEWLENQEEQSKDLFRKSLKCLEEEQ